MTKWMEGDLHTGEARLHLYRTGTLGKPPVVLAHGLSDNGTCWWRVADALSADHDVLAYDARNHGASGTAGASSNALVADLAVIIDEVELTAPILIGHSSGARTMAEFVAAHPGVASRLILLDPPWTASQEHDGTIPADRREVIRTWLSSLSDSNEADLTELAQTQHPDWPASEYPSWIASKQQVRPEAADALDGRGWGDVVAALDIPTLLLRGETERGGIVDDAVAARVGELNDMVTNQIVADAGHNLHRENYPGCIEAIRTFLAIT